MMSLKKIIISRTDNLGDVMLTLPMAGLLKSIFPGVEVYFIGKAYTKALIEACSFVDHFLNRDEIIQNPGILENINADCIIHVFPDKDIAKAAFKAKIKKRIGTSHRLFHWFYCNNLVNFSRKNSKLHEAQLNCKLLKPLGVNTIPDINSLKEFFGFKAQPLVEELSKLINSTKSNIIFHPKSKGSAREWPLENYYQLAQQLSKDQYQLFITGTEAEGNLIKTNKPQLLELENVTDLTGKLSLGDLVSFIDKSNGLLACSTGPLHIASALKKNALGIYPPMKPIHPGRWAPIGEKAEYLVLDKNCTDCKKTQKCHCIESIGVYEVKSIVEKW